MQRSSRIIRSAFSCMLVSGALLCTPMIAFADTPPIENPAEKNNKNMPDNNQQHDLATQIVKRTKISELSWEGSVQQLSARC